MRNLPLIILLFLPLTVLFAGTTYDLSEALEKGYIKLEAAGLGGHTEQSLKVRVTNQWKKKKWELVIPAGYLFASQDTTEQDLLVVRDRTIKMEKGKNRLVKLHALCTQAHHGSPRSGSAFLASALVTGHLLQLAQYLDQKRLSGSEAQDAVWAITDNHPINYIGNEALRAFMAKLLGKKMPQYTVDHQGRVRPGQPAFQPEPVLIRGTFQYKTDKACKATFGLYTESGERIVTGFENQEQRAGGHRFKFRLKVSNVPPGTYYVRMVAGEEVLGEMEVAF